MRHLEIDASRCTGHGRCYDLAPELFEPDENGHGVVTDAGAQDTFDIELARRVALVCPENAVLLVED